MDNIFVAFSEDLNFRSLQILDIISSWCDERKLWIQIYFTYILENVEDWTCQHLTWWKHHTFEFKAETIFNFRIASHYSKILWAAVMKWAFVIWTVIKMQIFNVDYKSSVIVRRPQNLKKYPTVSWNYFTTSKQSGRFFDILRISELYGCSILKVKSVHGNR